MLLIPSFSLQAYYEDSYSSKLYIDSLEISITLNRDGNAYIFENYRVNFPPSSYYHGFYRYLPLTGFDSRKIKIYDFKSTLNLYKSYKSKGFHIFMLGSPYAFMKGLRSFNLSYNIDIGKYVENGTDAFRYKVVSEDFNMPIKNLKVDVVFQDKIKTACFFDKDGNENFYTLSNDNTRLHFEKNEDINTIVVFAELQKGYYQNARIAFETKIPYLFMFVSFFVLLIIIIMYFKYGKTEKIISVIQFSPPEDLDLLEIAYLYKGQITGRDICAQIYYFASKGFVQIIEGKKDNIAFKKIKDADDTFKREEKILFDSIFSGGDIFQGGVISANVQDGIAASVDVVKARYTNDFMESKSSMRVRRISFSLIILNTVLLFSYLSYLISDNSKIAFFILIFFSFFLFSVMMRIVKKSNSQRKSIIVFCLSVIYSTVIDFFAIVLLGTSFAFSKAVLLMLLIFLCLSHFSLCCASFMKKHTDKYDLLLSSIYGFRDYLDAAEKEEIKLMVKDIETLGAYMDLLSFVILFMLEKKWASKFKILREMENNNEINSSVLTTVLVGNMYAKSIFSIGDGFFAFENFSKNLDHSLKIQNARLNESLVRDIFTNTRGGSFGGGTGGGTGGGSGGFGGGGAGAW